MSPKRSLSRAVFWPLLALWTILRLMKFVLASSALRMKFV
jgi:hypothetical protein